MFDAGIQWKVRCGPRCCTVVQCGPHSVPAPACRCFQFYIVSRQIWISDLQPGTRGIRERLHVLTGLGWSPGLMIVYRNVMLICSMLNKTLKTPTLLDSGWPSLWYRFYNWSGCNGSFVLRRLAPSFRRICRSQQQQVADSDIHQFIYKLLYHFTANAFSHSS